MIEMISTITRGHEVIKKNHRYVHQQLEWQLSTSAIDLEKEIFLQKKKNNLIN